MTAVRIADVGAAVALDVPVRPPPLYGDEIIATAALPVTDEAAFAALRRAALGGDLWLRVETGPGAPAVADVRFPAAAPGRWTRAQCS